MNKNKIASRGPPSNVGVNLAIVVFNAALISVMWAAVLEIAKVDRRETVNTAIDRNDNLTIALEQYTKRTIESADAVLQYMIREYVRNSRNFDLNQFVTDYTIDNKAFAGVVLADEHGNLATSAYMGKPAKPVNVADREHFSVHLERDTQEVFVGKPVIGRVTGKAVVPITRRVNKPDGSFGGVAMVLIEHSRFTDVLHDAKMRQLDIISVIGLDGITRARLRGTTATTGEDISKSPLFAEQAQRPVGNYAAPGQIDSIQRIFSYRTLPEYRLVATVGVAEADVLAGFYQRQRQYFWAAGMASGFITAFSLLLILMLNKQRQTAISVARSQSRFLATFNQAAVGITHTDLEGRCLEINQKLCDITGYSREELLGRKFTEITHPDDIAASIEFRKRVLADRDPINSLQREKRYIRKDGSIVWCLLTTSVVHDDAGNIDYMVAIIQDISELKATEKALRVLENAQRLLAEQAETERARLADAQAVAKIGSWETGFPGLKVIWSAETYRIFEADENHFEPSHPAFLEFIHPDDRAKVDAAFSSSLNDQSLHAIEHRIVLPDGRIKIAEERWRVFLDDQGQPCRAVGTCQDITEKKQAESDRAQLAAIVDSSNDAIVSRDLDGTIVSWNHAAECMFGWTAAEAIGKPAQIMTPVDRIGDFTHVLERVKSGETTAPFETERIRKSGARFDAQVSLSAVKDGQGKVVGIATIVRDISDRREQEAVLQKEKLFSDTMLDSMPGIVYFYDEEQRFLRWNRNFSRVSGYSPEEIARMGPLDFFGGSDKFLVEKTIKQVFATGESSVEAAFRSKDGSTTPYFFTGKRLVFDGSVCLVGMGIDISERKLAEAALRDYAAQMRHLSWRLSEVEERERRDIHRELHDQVGANLSALKLDLGLINNMLHADNQKAISERLQKTRQMMGETIARIRDVMANLRPPALDDYGLLAALRNYAEPFAERMKIAVSVDGDDIQPRLAIAVETALFRIVQEALTNIAKHAHARHVEITVKTTADRLTLLVTDDGSGFDTSGPRHDNWGLRTMRERAQAIAADFHIESSPGKGTQITVELKRQAA